MKVVEFDNGKWALRKFSLLMLQWVYKDLVTAGGNFWWTRRSPFFRDCLANSQEEVRRRADLFHVVRKVDV